MRIVLLTFLMVFLCSCSSKKSNDSSFTEPVIKIDLLSEQKYKVTKLSEFATNIEYVPLQTTKNSLLGEFAAKIVSVNDKIYIKNSGLDGEIMCFNKNGKFLFKIQHLGRGPGQYTFITDFDVSSDNTMLTILSTVDRKILLYNLSENGSSFEKALSLNSQLPSTIGMVPETKDVFLAIDPLIPSTPILSLLINNNGDTIHLKPNCFGSRQDKSLPHAKWDLVYTSKELLCFKELFSDTVFYVDAKEKTFKPRIIFDTHGTLITPEMIGHPEKMGDDKQEIRYVYEASRYVFYYLVYVKNDVLYYDCFLFDKTTKTKYKLDTDTVVETIANIPRDVQKIKLKDDLNGGPDFTQDVRQLNAHCSDGKMFSLVDAITLKNYVTTEAFVNARGSDSKKSQLKKLADSLNETDNPVLVIVTPKD